MGTKTADRKPLSPEKAETLRALLAARLAAERAEDALFDALTEAKRKHEEAWCEMQRIRAELAAWRAANGANDEAE